MGGAYCRSSQTGVKSALEVTGECLQWPATSSPHGVVGNDPWERSNTPPSPPPFPFPPFSHTDTQHTNTLLNLEELRSVWPGGGYRENLEWNMLSCIMLVDRPDNLLIQPPPNLQHLQSSPNAHIHTHQPTAEPPPTRPPLSHCTTVIHRVPKPAALLKPRKSKAWPRFKQQCSWDLLHFRQTALSVSLAINSTGGCLP